MEGSTMVGMTAVTTLEIHCLSLPPSSGTRGISGDGEETRQVAQQKGQVVSTGSRDLTCLVSPLLRGA